MRPEPLASCPNHPDVPAVGNCSRCGAFVCAAEWTLVDAAGYCPACAAREDVDYLEAFRKKHWGKRDSWAWLMGLSAPLQVASGVGALLDGAGFDTLLLGVLSIAGGLNSALFWWGVRLTRVGVVLLAAAWSLFGFFAIGPAVLLSVIFIGLTVRSLLASVRTKLFFQIDVPREALRKAWDRVSNNVIARNAFTLSLGGLLVPGLGPLAVVLGLIGLSRVDRKARPPVGKLGYAIAGIVLGLIGSVVGAALVWSLSR